MLKVDFDLNNRQSPCFLFIGAHADDIEIGCGGAILRLLRRFPNAQVQWVVFSGDKIRSVEARDSAKKFTASCKDVNIKINDFRDSYFPYIGLEIKEYFSEFSKNCNPDVIFTHYRNDLHQDHRLLSELTWNTFRDHFILEYEIPKWDGDFSQPNYFIEIPLEILERKLSILLSSFKSQIGRDWFTADSFKSIMRLRGIEARSVSDYAEAFHARKLVC